MYKSTNSKELCDSFDNTRYKLTQPTNTNKILCYWSQYYFLQLDSNTVHY